MALAERVEEPHARDEQHVRQSCITRPPLPLTAPRESERRPIYQEACGTMLPDGGQVPAKRATPQNSSHQRWITEETLANTNEAEYAREMTPETRGQLHYPKRSQIVVSNRFQALADASEEPPLYTSSSRGFQAPRRALKLSQR